MQDPIQSSQWPVEADDYFSEHLAAGRAAKAAARRDGRLARAWGIEDRADQLAAMPPADSALEIEARARLQAAVERDLAALYDPSASPAPAVGGIDLTGGPAVGTPAPEPVPTGAARALLGAIAPAKCWRAALKGPPAWLAVARVQQHGRGRAGQWSPVAIAAAMVERGADLLRVDAAFRRVAEDEPLLRAWLGAWSDRRDRLELARRFGT